MDEAQRSGCPINLTLEVVGDKWSLLIIRDMMFGNRRHFRELLTKSEEGISSNILADRLKTLLDQGIITWADDPSHKQKGIYSLTEQGIELLPILAQMSGWGFKYLPVSEELGIRAKLLSEGGPNMWAEYIEELRETHLGVKRRKKAGLSVGERLQKAYEKVVARKGKKCGADLRRGLQGLALQDDGTHTASQRRTVSVAPSIMASKIGDASTAWM
jgi:DNA-binding HxlR family transcriptional regulator